MEWQTIDTAPQGQQVLIYTPVIGVETAIQLEAMKRNEPDNKFWQWFVGQSSVNGGATVYIPTHWMPLPAEPTPESTVQEEK